MAVYNFPTNPQINDTYTGPNGVTYVWDGEKWLGQASTINLNDFVLKSANTQQAINSDVGITGNTTILGDTSMGGDANVAGDGSFGGDLGVGNNITVDGGGSFGNTVVIDGDANVSGDGTFGGDVDVGNNVTIGGDATVNGSVSATDVIANTAVFGSANVDVLGANVVYVDRIFIQGFGELSANNFDVSMNDLNDANTVGVTNGQVLSWNGVEWVPVDNPNVYTISASFDNTNGEITFTRNDGNTYSVNVDGRFVKTVNAVSPDANGNVYVETTEAASGILTARPANPTTNMLYTVDGDATGNGAVYFYETSLGQWIELYTPDSLSLSLGELNDVSNVAPSNGQFLRWDGTQWSPDTVYTTNNFIADIANSSIGALLDVDTTGAANGNVLYWNATTSTWEVIDPSTWDNYLTNGSFDGTTGDITLDMRDGTQHIFSIDGRYAKSVNGIVPDANGNVILSLAGVDTGDINSFPTNVTEGALYIVSGDADANNNGETYIWDGGSWQRIVSFDQAQSDIRYINASGDTMLGDLTLAGDPTTNLHAATKQYVDQLVANSEIYTANATFDATTSGVVTYTKNDGTTYTVDLDGRYLELTNGGQVDGSTLFTGGLQSNVAPVNGDDVTNKSYVDILVANSTVEISTVTLSANGDLTITETSNAANTTHTVNILADLNLDSRFVNANGDTITGDLVVSGNTEVQGTLIANNTTLIFGDLADVDVTTAANGDIVYWDATSSTWKTIAGDFVDNFVTSGSFSIANGDVSIARNDGNTITFNVDGRYLGLVDGGTVTGNTIFNGNLQTPTVPTSNNDVVNKLYVDALVANGEVTINGFTLAGANLTISETNGNSHTVDLFAGLDAQYVNVTGDTMTGDLVVSANVEVQGTLVANNTTLELKDLADTDGAMTPVLNQVLTWDGSQWIAANTASTYTTTDFVADFANSNIGDLLDVDTTGVANGSILYYDASASSWKVVAGDFFDSFISGASFSSANGDLTLTRNDGNTFVANFDGRYLELANGGTVTGNTIFNGNLQTPTTPTSNTDVTNKSYVDNAIAASEVEITNFVWTQATGNLNIVESNGNNHWVNLDGRYVQTVNGTAPDVNGNVAVSLTSVSTGDDASRLAATPVEGDVWVVSGDANTSLNGKAYIYDADAGSWYEVSPPDQAAYDARYVLESGDTMTGFLTLNADPSSALHAVTKQYVDALVANSEVYTSNATFANTTGDLTQTRTDGTTYVVNLDGRYVVSPSGASNGQVLSWDGTNWVAGNVSTTDTKISTINFTTSDGNLVITDTGGSSFDVDLDGRYLELTNGGTVTGNTVFSGNLQTPTVPTSNNDVVNKLYVDALVANAEVYTANATFNASKGNLTQRRTDGTAYTVNLDGRYIRLPEISTANGASPQTPSSFTNTMVLTWNGSDWVAAESQGGASVANGSISVANNSNIILTINNTDSTSANIDLTHSITNHTDVDTLTVPPTNGQVLSWDGTNWVPSDETHVVIADAPPASPLDGDLWYDSLNDYRTYVWSATASQWLDVAPSLSAAAQAYIISATQSANNTSISLTLNKSDGNTIVADTSHSITNHTDVDTSTNAPVANSSLLGWDGSNWIPVVSLDASSGAANDF